ncbi:SusC/RagA family TonB-linked outer membrane protein [Pedobacter sp. PWIIR3]
MNFSADAARNGDSIFRKYHTTLIYCMRITLLICFVISMSLQMVLASNASGQGMANVNVNIKLDNEDLASAIKKIESTTPFRFLYRTADIRDINSLTLNERSISVERLMKDLLTGTSLSFKQIDDRILITRNNLVSKKQPILNAGINLVSMADTVITGTVFDGKTKERIPSATVVLKDNRKNIVLTDSRGNFRISAPLGAVLLVSYIGYETQEVTATSKVLEIRLQEAPQSLKGVVVTGIVNQNKSTFTGAARTFNAEELSKVSNSNVLTALKSLDPSFQIPENLNIGSNPNILPDVVLRGGNTLVDIRQAGGTNTFNYQPTPNAPLFILDGFETTLQRINDLDMNRIASITILKDAGATAMYGSRGANGVIVVEQLRPVEGKLRVAYNASVSIEAPDLTGYSLLNAREKFELEDRSNVFVNPFNTSQNGLDLIRQSRAQAVASGVNTDWISKPLRTGIGQKHNINVDGGAESVTYGLNLTYDQNTGAMKGSDRTTTTGNSFLSYRLKKFQFRNDLTLNFNKANNSPYGSFKQYTRLNPYWSPTDADGNLKVYLEDVRDPQTGLRITSSDYYDNLNGYIGRPLNPLYNASLNITDKTKYSNITNNFETRYQALEWLRLTARLSYSKRDDQSDIFLPAQHSSFANVTTFEKGSYTQVNGNYQQTEGFLTAEANKNIDKHAFTFSGTLNVKENQYDLQSVKVVGFPNPNLDQFILGNSYGVNAKPTGSESHTRSLGTLASMSYSYDNRFLFDGTFRLDGSSLFGTQKRFAPFWSAGAGWNIHNEEFFKNNDNIQELKLRYTVGTTGSESFESYKGITTSQYYTDREYRGVIPSYLLGFGNETLAWQKTLKNNIGIDISIFDRFSLTANYFNERTKGSIAFISSAPSSGFPGYYDNMGDVVNKGYELYGRYNLIAKPANRNNWSIFANVFHVSNKIEKISSTIQALNNRANTTASSVPLPRYAEGQSVNVIWGVKSLGIDPSSGNELFQARDGSITTTYNPADQVIIGDATPTLSGTFGTNMEIKGIGLNIYVRFNFGGDTYNQTLVDRVENVNVAQYNVDSRVATSRWQNPGDLSYYRAIVNYAGVTSPFVTYSTSRFIQKNNFIAGESASIYYRFSDKLNKTIGLQNTKVTIFSSDIFRASSIKRERGIDYPYARSFTFQLQTAF